MRDVIVPKGPSHSKAEHCAYSTSVESRTQRNLDSDMNSCACCVSIVLVSNRLGRTIADRRILGACRRVNLHHVAKRGVRAGDEVFVHACMLMRIVRWNQGCSEPRSQRSHRSQRKPVLQQKKLCKSNLNLYFASPTRGPY